MQTVLHRPHNITLEMSSAGKRIQYPVFVEWKLDGEFNVLKTDTSTPDLQNKYGKLRWNFPVTDAFKGIKCIVLGELHWGDGKNGALYDFLKHKEDDGLYFTMFDCLEYEGISLRLLSLMKRREALIDIIQRIHMGWVYLSKSVWCENIDEVNECIEENKRDGYEGVVIKPAHSVFNGGSNWIKIKHTATMDLSVARVDPALERIDVWVPSESANTATLCGVKVMNKVKATLKIGDIVEIKHFGRLSQGGLRHPSFVRKRYDKTKPSYI